MRERSDRAGGGGGGGVGPPSHGKEIFFLQNSCMKTAFFCILNAIIRGNL